MPCICSRACDTLLISRCISPLILRPLTDEIDPLPPQKLLRKLSRNASSRQSRPIVSALQTILYHSLLPPRPNPAFLAARHYSHTLRRPRLRPGQAKLLDTRQRDDVGDDQSADLLPRLLASGGEPAEGRRALADKFDPLDGGEERLEEAGARGLVSRRREVTNGKKVRRRPGWGGVMTLPRRTVR